MRGPLFVFALVGVVAILPESPAQPIPKPKDGKLVIPLTVSPAALPIPALKYQLLPELRDALPGNQIPAFYKCFMEQHHFYREKEAIAKREKWSAAPLAELAGEKELIGYGGSSLRQADYAARLDHADWALLDRLKTDGIALLLPDVQQMRELAGALKVKMRGEVARKDFDAAIRTAQTMFALAHTFNTHPTLIGQLVGLAITAITLGVVEELIQQPGAPNLFWALADLPAPFIDMRKGMQGERAWLPKETDVLRKSDPLPEHELKKLIAVIQPVAKLIDDKVKTDAAAWYGKQAGDAAEVAAAKGRLAKVGFEPAALDKLSPLQLVMMDDYARYEVYRDDLMKWTNLPYWQAPADLAERKLPPGLFAEFAPAVGKVRAAQARVQQVVALLQAVEAVRAYAAANGGKLPPTLEATKLPVPADPFTGKPFVYEVKGDTAVIHGTPPPDRKAEPHFNRVYEVTVRK